ncbi:hypothetical protein TSAR_006042 [Trichomalopsis sarcophagae]|uniref:Uncharacterized protein n=1 Tax=Trichomalopsis sarcophagae TaxID=543379 RepID=A0A232FEG1_9HYME|nr:hypothetical protein TSAR_006042 [Trichomalopsis sarcophagae]
MERINSELDITMEIIPGTGEGSSGISRFRDEEWLPLPGLKFELKFSSVVFSAMLNNLSSLLGIDFKPAEAEAAEASLDCAPLHSANVFFIVSAKSVSTSSSEYVEYSERSDVSSISLSPINALYSAFELGTNIDTAAFVPLLFLLRKYQFSFQECGRLRNPKIYMHVKGPRNTPMGKVVSVNFAAFLICCVSWRPVQMSQWARRGKKQFNVKIDRFIPDALAKAFVLNTKYSSGYSSCSKCIVEGEYFRSVCFPITDLKSHEYCHELLRTDTKFKNLEYLDDYQKHLLNWIRVLIRIGVFKVPLDSMYRIYLGAMRQLMRHWLGSKGRCNKYYKLLQAKITTVSDRFERLSFILPFVFNRRCRSLTYCKIWKATEFRHFYCILEQRF